MPRRCGEFYGAAMLDPARPLFDVTLLGLGEDGHTASLFPGVTALTEKEAWTAAVIGAKPEPRLTLTYPALDSSRYAAFLAVGAGKKAMLTRVPRRGSRAARPRGSSLWDRRYGSPMPPRRRIRLPDMVVLAGDIGGTTTRLALVSPERGARDFNRRTGIWQFRLPIPAAHC